MSDPLFTPFTLKNLVLRNRIVSTSHEPPTARTACRRSATAPTTGRRPVAASR